MATRPFSLRLDDRLLRDLEREASRRRIAPRTLAQQVLEEGIRTRLHPLVAFADRGGWRDPILARYPRVRVLRIAEASAAGSAPVEIANAFALPLADMEAALAYYRSYRTEVDRHIAAEATEAEEAERAFRERQPALRA